uniref:site-specific DNA-methyltransferase (adenine-specific) n=1 Tax=Thermosporothrix sp. COM3 TaxID=2490863 RepID=A0A455SG17_9CHLR|nr:hypothetical protein KTC_10490 [Thermosporothrix sp. COM3]
MATETPARQHATWLSLIDISGPFLSTAVLLEVFKHGLDTRSDEVEVRRRLRTAYDEWADNQEGLHPDRGIHYQWLRFVLTDVLNFRPEYLREGQQITENLRYTVKEHGETLFPDLVIQAPDEAQPRLLVQLYPMRQNLEKAVTDSVWKVSPATKMMELLRGTGMRLGLVTNGRSWMLVDAPPQETTGYYTWDATIWTEEPITLRAFYNVLGMYRFYGVPDEETLEALLSKSAESQQEVTNQLGDQVLRAVELLIKTLDRLDKDRQRTLLQDVDEKTLYEAALTVMMRLVFLLSAEERGLLCLGEALYDQNYAISTMGKQLREQADQQTEEVLGLRYDAWSRLLALFRMVYGGVDHPDLRLPAYGGHLFDPDRFPFLEGRPQKTSWRTTPAHPLAIDNRTVLYLLDSLQYLRVREAGGTERRRLSFRGLDVEQIGHVYEGLLDHTAKRSTTTILGLQGTKDAEAETTLEELEAHAAKGEEALLAYLAELTKRGVSPLRKALHQTLDDPQARSRLMEACDNKQDIFSRVLPYAALLRKDSLGNYAIVTPGSIYVTKGAERRQTGTHYTPRSLTEPIVKHALDPLVYVGPAEGKPEEAWQLKSAPELLELTICDMAMGSGAFLVQSCRYLAEKLVEAWEREEQRLRQDGRKVLVITDSGALTISQGEYSELLLPNDIEERLALARRMVAERCLYGVDKNPMAAEMAKLSLWLVTLAREKPFTFLDHALRHGDSLLGASDQQLENWSLVNEKGEPMRPFVHKSIQRLLQLVLELRKQVRALSSNTIKDVEKKERLLREADQALEIARLGADILVAHNMDSKKKRAVKADDLSMSFIPVAEGYIEGIKNRLTEEGKRSNREAYKELRAEADKRLKGRKPFHWHLEFPEVFLYRNGDAGFSAIVSNPPFQGGQKITGALGTDYRDYLVKYLAKGKHGSADLCAYFYLRATGLLQQRGMAALVATNTIAQGATRKVGLDQLVEEGITIPRAVPSRRWPGDAALEVAYAWLYKGDWNGLCVLDDREVISITPYLTAPGKAQGKPLPLLANAQKSFIGSLVLGMGFVLEPEEAQALIARDARNKDVLFPYLNGKDLNSQPDQSPGRWVINFHDWPLEKAQLYPDCLDIVIERAKPERDVNNDRKVRGKWWQFKRPTIDLYSTIAHMQRVIVRARIANMHAPAYVPNGWVYNEKTVVFAHCSFTVLQSSIHEAWARKYSSTLKADMQYTPSDCFETFPFPRSLDGLDDIGKRYHEHRQAICLRRQEGLTTVYNRLHNPKEKAPDIVALRELHREMDEAVARAYGWTDLQLEHGFHETAQGLRFTISERARLEVLDRLLELNHQRHREEQAAGLVDKTGKPTKKGKAWLEQRKKQAANGHNGHHPAAHPSRSGNEADDDKEGDRQNGYRQQDLFGSEYEQPTLF